MAEDPSPLNDDPEQAASARVEALARKADSVRAELDRLLLELRRRGQRALDWKEQLRRHPLVVALPAVLLVGGLLAAWLTGRAQRRQAPLQRLRRLLAMRG